MKSDVERGPFGAWAFHARDLLDMSVEQVAEGLGYHPASLRKMESGSAPASRRMRRELPELYRRVATEKGVALSAAPVEQAQAADDPGLTAAIRELVEEVRLGRLAQERTEDRLTQMLAALVHVSVGAEAWSRIESELAAPVGLGNR